MCIQICYYDYYQHHARYRYQVAQSRAFLAHPSVRPDNDTKHNTSNSHNNTSIIIVTSIILVIIIIIIIIIIRVEVIEDEFDNLDAFADERLPGDLWLLIHG